MSGSTNRLGLEMLTLLGINPVEQVRIASQLGCSGVSLGIAALDLKSFGIADLQLYEHWSLAEEPALRRELTAALADTGVRVTLGEGFMITPAYDIREREAHLDIMAQLGTERIMQSVSSTILLALTTSSPCCATWSSLEECASSSNLRR